MNAQDELNEARAAAAELRKLETLAKRLPALEKEARQRDAQANLERVTLTTKQSCATLEDEIASVYTVYQSDITSAIETLKECAAKLHKVRSLESKLFAIAQEYLGKVAILYESGGGKRGHGQAEAGKASSRILTRPLRRLPAVPENSHGLHVVMNNLLNLFAARHKSPPN